MPRNALYVLVAAALVTVHQPRLAAQPVIAPPAPPGSLIPADLGGPGPVVTDATAGWTLTLPHGWRQISQDLVEAANQTVRKISPDAQFAFTHGFTTATDGSLAFPYVLVQRSKLPLDNATFEDLEKVLSQAAMQTGIEKVEQATGGSVQGFMPGRTILDRRRGVAHFDLDVSSPGGPTGRGRCWMFFAKDGIIQLNCYDDASTFGQRLPEFEAMASSFSFAPGRGFQAPATSPIRSGSRRALVGLACGILGGVVAVIWIRRKHR